MNILEKILTAYQKNDAVPLKGHVKVILEDVRDGKQKVEEVDNLVTNALGNILAHNYCGLANFATLFPLRQLFGGVFCLQNAQVENADNYNPQSDLVNPLVAHAGDIANNTGSTLRGSPVNNDFVVTDTSIKQVWLWDNTQGNGHIESISLVPSVLGNMGLKPFDNEFSPFSTFGRDGITNQSWSEEISKQYPFNISADGKTAATVWLDGTTFKEYIIRHDYTAFGIMRGTRDWQEVTNRSATVRSGNNRFIFDDDDYYYVARASSSTTLQVDKINKTTFAVTQADCAFSGVELFTGNFNSSAKNNCMRLFGFDGTYLYYPNSAKTSFYKLNISDNSDKLLLGGTISIWDGVAGVGGCQFVSPFKVNSGIIVGGNYIINGNNVYPLKNPKGLLEDIGNNAGLDHFVWTVKQGAAVYGHCKQTYWNSIQTGQGPILCQMFLSSIANLQSGQNKSTSQTMRVEYTLTEQT